MCCSSVSMAASQSGTAEVWAGVPLIGHVYVCTPYTAYYNSSMKVTSVETGESYTSAGIAFVTYSAYDSWAEITGHRTFDVYARGHCDFVFKGCPISMGLQTFVASMSI